VGGKYPNVWHWAHMSDPRSISPGSNMPSYAHMATTTQDYAHTQDKLLAMKTVGVPYTNDQVQNAVADAKAQAAEIVADLKTAGIDAKPDSDLVAVIAYLQRLGKNGPPPPPPGKTNTVSANP
jgi:cytochrome c oxidase cbb3-type subunit I/II